MFRFLHAVDLRYEGDSAAKKFNADCTTLIGAASRDRDFEHERVNTGNQKPDKESSVFGGPCHDPQFRSRSCDNHGAVIFRSVRRSFSIHTVLTGGRSSPPPELPLLRQGANQTAAPALPYQIRDVLACQAHRLYVSLAWVMAALLALARSTGVI